VKWAYLKEYVESLPEGLDAPVKEVARRLPLGRGNSYVFPGLCCGKQNYWFWTKVITPPS
jgi:hypothetical protein